MSEWTLDPDFEYATDPFVRAVCKARGHQWQTVSMEVRHRYGLTNVMCTRCYVYGLTHDETITTTVDATDSTNG